MRCERRRCFRGLCWHDEVEEAFLTPASSFAGTSFLSFVSFASHAEAQFSAEVCEAGSGGETVRRRLCEELRRTASFVYDSSPLASARLPGAGAAWQNCNTTRKSCCFVQTTRRPPGREERSETRVVISLESVDHVPELPLVQTLRDGSMSGALMTILEFELWPQWMPMCQSAEVLKCWSPGEQIVRIDFRLPIVRIHLECLVYVCLVDRLQEEGCLELLACSFGSAAAKAVTATIEQEEQEAAASSGAPLDAAASEAATTALPKRSATSSSSFLGVSAGSRRKRFGMRTEVHCVSLRIYPTGGSHGRAHRIRLVLSGEERCPMDSAVCMIWRMLSRSLISVLSLTVGQQQHQPMVPSRHAFYADLERKILQAAECSPAGTGTQA
mmetsp:Transcript_103003/g.181480  ORF Transcript_103003/g.181480 Transcript_103003/m.181480 type:complete len:385 (-) Transcript_103003:101-1255(-)